MNDSHSLPTEPDKCNSLKLRLILANEIKASRKQIGLSQESLAKQTGLSRASIAGFEAYNQTPSFENLLKLKMVLGFSLDEIVKKYFDDSIKVSRVKQTRITTKFELKK